MVIYSLFSLNSVTIAASTITITAAAIVITVTDAFGY